jgi:hypothetical protein
MIFSEPVDGNQKLERFFAHFPSCIGIVGSMFFPKQNKSISSHSSSILIIFVSSILGIFSAAISQRFNNLFFYNVFVGSIFSGVISFFLFSLASKREYIHNIIRPYAIVLSILISFSFLSTIPLTIDRSYSVWLLKNLTEAESIGKIVNRDALVEQSSDFFSSENAQLDRRIDEQSRLGNLIILEKGIVKISSKGLFWARINNYIGIVFALEPKYSRLKSP